MNAPVHTKTFKSGNSEAVRLPQGLGFGIGTEVRIERQGGRLTLTPIVDRESQRRAMMQLYEDMVASGVAAAGVRERDPFEFIERPGLE